MLWFFQRIENTGYEVLLACVLGNILAQIAKTITYSFSKRKFHSGMLISTGGMPSSHSSTVCAMASSVGLISGWSSVSFAITCCLAGVVMYDAAGVRQAASRQAWVINLIVRELLSENHKLKKERLKELLGHTPTEVLAGAVFGVGISFGFHFLIEYVIQS